MSRYTQKSYIADLAIMNKNLAERLSFDFVAFGGRYNMTYSDRVLLRENGNLDNFGAVECGTPREALQGADRVYYQAKENKTVTREQAKQLAFIYGINFDKDFYQLDRFDVEFLVKLAKASKYRKPKAANGSLARYFYNHLEKRVKTEKHYTIHNLIGE